MCGTSIVILFPIPSGGIFIGFGRTVYTTTEGTDPSVELCANVTSGSLGRDAIVLFSTSDGTATSTGWFYCLLFQFTGYREAVILTA